MPTKRKDLGARFISIAPASGQNLYRGSHTTGHGSGRFPAALQDAVTAYLYVLSSSVARALVAILQSKFDQARACMARGSSNQICHFLPCAFLSRPIEVCFSGFQDTISRRLHALHSNHTLLQVHSQTRQLHPTVCRNEF